MPAFSEAMLAAEFEAVTNEFLAKTPVQILSNDRGKVRFQSAEYTLWIDSPEATLEIAQLDYIPGQINRSSYIKHLAAGGTYTERYLHLKNFMGVQDLVAIACVAGQILTHAAIEHVRVFEGPSMHALVGRAPAADDAAKLSDAIQFLPGFPVRQGVTAQDMTIMNNVE